MGANDVETPGGILMSSESRSFAPVNYKTRLPALDGLRALAVALVFLDHYNGGKYGGTILRAINHVGRRGETGVDLFFVLSGFLITGILYDTCEDSRFFQRFYFRRALRILPVFYIVVVLLALMTPIFHYQWQWMQLTFVFYIGNIFANHHWALYGLVSPRHPWANANIAHFWSLCVEEQFYLLWPVAVWLIRDRIRLIWTAAGLSALTLALRLAVISHFSGAIAERWIIRTLPFRMDSLLIGAILALLLRGPAADLWQRSAKWMFWAAAGAVLAIFTLSPAYDSPWYLSIGLTLTAIAAAGLIGMAVREGSPAFRLFHLSPLRTLGKYSYGFYVYHVLFRNFWQVCLRHAYRHLHSAALSGLIVVPAAFAVSFLAAKLSYDLIEIRFLRLKRYFLYDSELSGKRQMVAAR